VRNADLSIEYVSWGVHRSRVALTGPWLSPPCRLDFGSKPIERQLILSAQFLHNELPVRLAHRVAELENLPYGLSAKPHVLRVRDWYVESFKDLRTFPKVRDANDEVNFTGLLKHIYSRHRNVVPVMAMGVAGERLTPTPAVQHRGRALPRAYILLPFRRARAFQRSLVLYANIWH